MFLASPRNRQGNRKEKNTENGLSFLRKTKGNKREIIGIMLMFTLVIDIIRIILEYRMKQGKG